MRRNIHVAPRVSAGRVYHGCTRQALIFVRVPFMIYFCLFSPWQRDRAQRLHANSSRNMRTLRMQPAWGSTLSCALTKTGTLPTKIPQRCNACSFFPAATLWRCFKFRCRQTGRETRRSGWNHQTPQANLEKTTCFFGGSDRLGSAMKSLA